MRNRVNARGIEIANMSASDKLWGMVCSPSLLIPYSYKNGEGTLTDFLSK